MSKSGIKKVIVLGSGALKIGQAGEFDCYVVYTAYLIAQQ